MGDRRGHLRTLAKKDSKDGPLHTFAIGQPGDPDGRAVRLAGVPAPVAIRVREGRGRPSAYYRVTGQLIAMFGPRMTVCSCPTTGRSSSRMKSKIREIAGGDLNTGLPPRAGLGARQPRPGRLRHQEPGRHIRRKTMTSAGPMTRWSCALFKGIDCWMFGVDDADSIVLHADATSRGREASEAVSRQIDSLLAHRPAIPPQRTRSQVARSRRPRTRRPG